VIPVIVGTMYHLVVQDSMKKLPNQWKNGFVVAAQRVMTNPNKDHMEKRYVARGD